MLIYKQFLINFIEIVEWFEKIVKKLVKFSVNFQRNFVDLEILEKVEKILKSCKEILKKF